MQQAGGGSAGRPDPKLWKYKQLAAFSSESWLGRDRGEGTAGRLSPARWQWGLAEAVKWWCGHAESSVVVGALCSWFGHFPLGCTEMCEAARPEILEKHLPCSDFDLFSSCTRCPALSSAGVLQIPRSALGCSASQSPAVLAAPGQPTSATSNLFFSFPSLAFLC